MHRLWVPLARLCTAAPHWLLPPLFATTLPLLLLVVLFLQCPLLLLLLVPLLLRLLLLLLLLVPQLFLLLLSRLVQIWLQHRRCGAHPSAAA